VLLKTSLAYWAFFPGFIACVLAVWAVDQHSFCGFFSWYAAPDCFVILRLV